MTTDNTKSRAYNFLLFIAAFLHSVWIFILSLGIAVALESTYFKNPKINNYIDIAGLTILLTSIANSFLFSLFVYSIFKKKEIQLSRFFGRLPRKTNRLDNIGIVACGLIPILSLVVILFFCVIWFRQEISSDKAMAFCSSGVTAFIFIVSLLWATCACSSLAKIILSGHSQEKPD